MSRETTDQRITEVLEKLQRMKVENAAEKQTVVEEVKLLIDKMLIEGHDNDYLVFQSKRKLKNIRSAVGYLVAGILMAFIPSFFYIMSLHKDIVSLKAGNEVPPFHFVPDAIAYPKPLYVQIIKTQEQVDQIKKSQIRDAQLASIGAVVKFGGSGLIVWSKEEVNSSTYHLKDIGVQKDKIKVIGDYTLVPDTLLTRDPLFVEVLHELSTVQIAKQDTNLLEKELIGVGTAIHCPKKARCFVIAKANLEKDYKKVVPIKPYSR